MKNNSNNKKIPRHIMNLIDKSKTFNLNFNIDDSLKQFSDFILNNLESHPY